MLVCNKDDLSGGSQGHGGTGLRRLNPSNNNTNYKMLVWYNIMMIRPGQGHIVVMLVVFYVPHNSRHGTLPYR